MRLIPALALLAAMSAHAGPALRSDEITLQGQWRYEYLSNARYYGVIVIDAQHGAVLTGRWTGGGLAAGSVRETGRVEINGPAVEIIFTAATATGVPLYSPDRFHCALLSSDVMDCYNHDTAGSVSARFILQRIGVH